MSDVEAATGITVTIKYGKGYEESWSVFRGDEVRVRKDIMSYFGLTEEVTAGLTLHEVVIQATQIAHGNTVLSNVLGATPVSQQSQESGPKGAAAWQAAGGGAAESEEPVHPHAVLIERLKAAGTVEDLKQLWARNQEAFSDEDVAAAYSARGKALTAA